MIYVNQAEELQKGGNVVEAMGNTRLAAKTPNSNK